MLTSEKLQHDFIKHSTVYIEVRRRRLPVKVQLFPISLNHSVPKMVRRDPLGQTCVIDWNSCVTQLKQTLFLCLNEWTWCSILLSLPIRSLIRPCGFSVSYERCRTAGTSSKATGAAWKRGHPQLMCFYKSLSGPPRWVCGYARVPETYIDRHSRFEWHKTSGGMRPQSDIKSVEYCLFKHCFSIETLPQRGDSSIHLGSTC